MKARKRRTRRDLGKPRGVAESSTSTWIPLIKYAEQKLDRARIKVLQLEAIVEDFRRQAKAGEPSPIDIANEIRGGTP